MNMVLLLKFLPNQLSITSSMICMMFFMVTIFNVIKSIDYSIPQLVLNLMFVTCLIGNPLMLDMMIARPINLFIACILILFYVNCLKCYKNDTSRLFLLFGMATSSLLLLGNTGIALSLSFLLLSPLIFKKIYCDHSFAWALPLILFPACSIGLSLWYLTITTQASFVSLMLSKTNLLSGYNFWNLGFVAIAMYGSVIYKHRVGMFEIFCLPLILSVFALAALENSFLFTYDLICLLSFAWLVSSASLNKINLPLLGLAVSYYLFLSFK